VIGTTDPAAPVDKRIEHQVEELVKELESDALRASCGFTGELIERPVQIAASQFEDSQEVGRQRAAIVEGIVKRVADVGLISRLRWKPPGCRGHSPGCVSWLQCRDEIKDGAVAGVAEDRAESHRQSAGAEAVERADAPPTCG
jgi:hypothetical protein